MLHQGDSPRARKSAKTSPTVRSAKKAPKPAISPYPAPCAQVVPPSDQSVRGAPHGLSLSWSAQPCQESIAPLHKVQSTVRKQCKIFARKCDDKDKIAASLQAYPLKITQCMRTHLGQDDGVYEEVWLPVILVETWTQNKLTTSRKEAAKHACRDARRRVSSGAVTKEIIRPGRHGGCLADTSPYFMHSNAQPAAALP